MNQPSAIVYRYGDMFQQYDRGVMFVPVNCKGVMGAGLALKVAQRNPGLELLYRDLCQNQLFRYWSTLSNAYSRWYNNLSISN